MPRGFAPDKESGEWIWVMIKKETEKAWLVFDGDGDKWLPKSQILDIDGDDPGEGIVTKLEIKTWIAEKNNFNVNNDQSDVIPQRKLPVQQPKIDDEEKPF